MVDIVGTVDPIKNIVSMGDRRYNTQKTVEDEEKELDDLIQQQKEDAEVAERQAKAEAEEFHEPDSADERTFKKRYGDLRRHSQKQQKTNEEKIGVLQEQLDVATKTQIKLPKSEAELLTIHPDFTTIRAQDDFHTWAEEQPQWVQDALYENETDAHAAARAIDLYKSDRGFETSPKKRGKKATNAKDAARFVDTKSTKSLPETSGRKNKWSESKVDQMNAIEYEKYSDEIMEAIKDGDFLYDMSRKAS